MSSSDAQPPLSRRQARERERAANGGATPATPPPTVAPASQPTAPGERRRPGSHVAPAAAAPAQSAGPASAVPSTNEAPPASATEIVPGTGGLTRRQIRQLRESQDPVVRPVPLQTPTPQSSDRTVEDVLGTVQQLEDQNAAGRPAQAPGIVERPEAAGPTPVSSSRAAVSPSGDASSSAGAAPLAPSGFDGVVAPTGTTAPTSAPSSVEEPDDSDGGLDPAAVEQATSADGSPDHIEPLDQAAAHADEPRRHRSTWSAPDTTADDAAEAPEPDAHDPIAGLPGESLAARTPGVFPLSLDGDTSEVPVPADSSRAASAGSPSSAPAPASAPTAADQPGPQRAIPAQSEPKPVTTAFDAPAGHWSLQAEDHHDAEVHDDETGVRRVAERNTTALVLPNSALSDVTGALNATGEVIITGSIDLPKSLSSTGSHRPIDGAEVDRLLEQQDEQPETDASPVRASRAVSSHTSTRQVVLAAAKPKESRTPLILGVSAVGLGIAAVAIVVVALVTTHVFG